MRPTLLILLLLPLCCGPSQSRAGAEAESAEANIVEAEEAAEIEARRIAAETGLITLSFTNEPIKQVIRHIAWLTGTNIVALDDLNAQVTVSLKDVQWQDALDALLEQAQARLYRKLGIPGIYLVDKRHLSGKLDWIRTDTPVPAPAGDPWLGGIRLQLQQSAALPALQAWARASGISIAMEPDALPLQTNDTLTCSYDGQTAENVALDLCKTFGLAGRIWKNHLFLLSLGPPDQGPLLDLANLPWYARMVITTPLERILLASGGLVVGFCLGVVWQFRRGADRE